MKLIISGLAGNCENTIDMCIKSVIEVADAFVIIYDTTSKDSTYKKLEIWKNKYPDKFTIIKRPYEHDPNIKDANSKARNCYLNYLKEKHDGDWNLTLDMDEVCDENFKNIRNNFDEYDKLGVEMINPKMIHFIGDLGHVDNTVPEHHCLGRLFKIMDDIFYPEGEHPVLAKESKGRKKLTVGFDNSFIIYHLGSVPNLAYYKERYQTHSAKSEIHTQYFLDWWYTQHILGEYPRKKINIQSIPKIIKEEFLINEDYIYFRERKMEYKHWIDIFNWKEFFKLGENNGI